MTDALVPMIAANWKMNGLRADAAALAAAIAGALSPAGLDVVICPPATLLTLVGEILAGSGVRLGAQDCHRRPAGAFTGDISPAMLRDAGCRYVILGHSERRTLHHETDAEVHEKAVAAFAAGLDAIICVGETEAEREAGRALEVVAGQIRGSVPRATHAGQLVVAYEPVWAIGTGRTPTVGEIAVMHAEARRVLADCLPDGAGVRVLYGGSVKRGNAHAILAIPGVNGALVGGASLDADEFLAIVGAASRVTDRTGPPGGPC